MKHFVAIRPAFSGSARAPHTARLLPASKLPYHPLVKHQQARNYAFPEAMEAVKQTVAQNFGFDASHKLVPEDQQFNLEQTPSLKRKVAVITGGSEGIGYGAAHTFLSKGISKLFILSVSKEVIDGALEAIRQEMGEEVAKKVIWLKCDISDWHAVKETADKIASSTDRLDILVNNAGRGIMTYQLTDYGVDRHVSVRGLAMAQSFNENIDGNESHGPCHPYQSPPSSHEKDRILRQYRPHL